MIVIATTVAPWKCNGIEELAWLFHAEAMIDDAASVGHEVMFFATVETDARGRTPFNGLDARLLQIQSYEGARQHKTVVNTWEFRIDDWADEVTSRGRLIHICEGRNLIHEYAMRTNASHILFLDSDTEVPGDSITKLLEVDHPVVGGEIPTYCLSGPEVPGFDFPVQEHWNTAGFLLVRREVFSKLRWRWSLEDGMSDDPCFQNDQQVWGFGQTWVRKDVRGQHHPGFIVPVENRDVDKRIYR